MVPRLFRNNPAGRGNRAAVEEFCEVIVTIPARLLSPGDELRVFALALESIPVGVSPIWSGDTSRQAPGQWHVNRFGELRQLTLREIADEQHACCAAVAR